MYAHHSAAAMRRHGICVWMRCSGPNAVGTERVDWLIPLCWLMLIASYRLPFVGFMRPRMGKWTMLYAHTCMCDWLCAYVCVLHSVHRLPMCHLAFLAFAFGPDTGAKQTPHTTAVLLLYIPLCTAHFSFDPSGERIHFYSCLYNF